MKAGYTSPSAAASVSNLDQGQLSPDALALLGVERIYTKAVFGSSQTSGEIIATDHVRYWGYRIGDLDIVFSAISIAHRLACRDSARCIG